MSLFFTYIPYKPDEDASGLGAELEAVARKLATSYPKPIPALASGDIAEAVAYWIIEVRRLALGGNINTAWWAVDGASRGAFWNMNGSGSRADEPADQEQFRNIVRDLARSTFLRLVAERAMVKAEAALFEVSQTEFASMREDALDIIMRALDDFEEHQSLQHVYADAWFSYTKDAPRSRSKVRALTVHALAWPALVELTSADRS